MIQSLIVTNPKGEELTLDLFRPELSGLYIKSIDGLGPPSASINTQDVATIDGALYVGSRLETRNLTIELGTIGRTESSEGLSLFSDETTCECGGRHRQ